MAFNLGDVFVTLKAKSEDLKRGLDDAQKKVRSISDGMSKSFKAAETGSTALLGTITAVAGATVIFGKKSVDAYFAAAEASTKLRTNMLNVHGETERGVEMLEAYASHMQNLGVVEDDVIKAGMSQLATFNLTSDSIHELTPKILDMVVQLKGHNATAEDTVAINNLVGKVMTGNVGALSRYGVTLSENQAELLRNGDETQRVNVLNEVLAQNYGNVNEELRKTPQGRITGLKNAFGDLQESVGELIVTAISPLIDNFATWISKVEEAGGLIEYFKQLIHDNQKVVWALGGAIGIALIPALYSLAAAFIAMAAPILPFLALGAGIGLLFKNLIDNGINPLKGALDILRAAWEFLKPSIVALWEVIASELLPTLQRLWDALSPVLLPLLKFLAFVIGVTLVAAIWASINALRLIIGWISNFINWGVTAGTAIVNAFKTAASAITTPFKAAFNAIVRFWNGTVGKLKFKAPSWVPGIGGKGWEMPQLDMLALGTPSWKGGLAGMNEFGPETAVLPKGTRVITADDTRRAEKAGGNVYHMHFEGVMARSDSELADIMESGIKALDRRLEGAGRPKIMGGTP